MIFKNIFENFKMDSPLQLISYEKENLNLTTVQNIVLSFFLSYLIILAFYLVYFIIYFIGYLVSWMCKPKNTSKLNRKAVKSIHKSIQRFINPDLKSIEIYNVPKDLSKYSEIKSIFSKYGNVSSVWFCILDGKFTGKLKLEFSTEFEAQKARKEIALKNLKIQDLTNNRMRIVRLRN